MDNLSENETADTTDDQSENEDLDISSIIIDEPFIFENCSEGSHDCKQSPSCSIVSEP